MQGRWTERDDQQPIKCVTDNESDRRSNCEYDGQPWPIDRPTLDFRQVISALLPLESGDRLFDILKNHDRSLRKQHTSSMTEFASALFNQSSTNGKAH